MFKDTTQTAPATPAETQADLILEAANLRQENTELHEIIGAQMAEIERLQAANKSLRNRLVIVTRYLNFAVRLLKGDE